MVGEEKGGKRVNTLTPGRETNQEKRHLDFYLCFKDIFEFSLKIFKAERSFVHFTSLYNW